MPLGKLDNVEAGGDQGDAELDDADNSNTGLQRQPADVVKTGVCAAHFGLVLAPAGATSGTMGRSQVVEGESYSWPIVIETGEEIY